MGTLMVANNAQTRVARGGDKRMAISMSVRKLGVTLPPNNWWWSIRVLEGVSFVG